MRKLRTTRRHGFLRDLARYRTKNFAAAKIFENFGPKSAPNRTKSHAAQHADARNRCWGPLRVVRKLRTRAYDCRKERSRDHFIGFWGSGARVDTGESCKAHLSQAPGLSAPRDTVTLSHPRRRRAAERATHKRRGSPRAFGNFMGADDLAVEIASNVPIDDVPRFRSA